MANNLTLVQQKLSERLRACTVSADFDPDSYEVERGAEVCMFWAKVLSGLFKWGRCDGFGSSRL